MSPKFRFRLDPVLGHRERVERERAGEHAQALADQLAAQRMYDEIVEKRDELRLRLVREHAHFDAETLRSTYTHLDYLDRAIIASLQRVEACAAETERARVRLVAAAKDRKVLETLKERRQEAHQLDAALADQRELDDQNARLFGRAQPVRRTSVVIVTRHRRRRSSAGRILIPLLLIAVLGFVLSFPPTQRAIANGPLKPAWTVAANAGGVVARPFTFAAQQESINERNRRIQNLNAQLEQQRKAKTDADARAQQLQQQMTALQNQPQVTPVPAPRPTAAAAGIAGVRGLLERDPGDRRREAARRDVGGHGAGEGCRDRAAPARGSSHPHPGQHGRRQRRSDHERAAGRGRGADQPGRRSGPARLKPIDPTGVHRGRLVRHFSERR